MTWWQRRTLLAATTISVALALLVGFALPTRAVEQRAWRPTQGTSWQIQFNGQLDSSVAVRVFDVDGFDTSAKQVAALHARGKRVICYISVGSYEKWRPDAKRFPARVKGKSNGWAGERWLDIRKTRALLPIMSARIKMCAKKGFDAVDPDNVDGFRNATGFRLKAKHQVAYNRAIAKLAHKHGLSVGLKNDLSQAKKLEKYFDFAINESCSRYAECGALQPFLKAGKAVLHVEYNGSLNRSCATVPRGFSSIRKQLDLGSWLRRCS